MLLTEDEAKEKGCCGPAGIVAMLGVIVIEQGGSVKFEEGAGRCMASKCMAWQQEMRVTGYNLPDEPTGRGCCGLAGKPEG